MKKFNFEKFGFYRNIFFIGFFALFLFLLIFSTTFDVHASSDQTSDLPYVVSSMDHYNEGMLTHLDEALVFYYQSFNVPADTPVVVWTNDGYFNGLYYSYEFMREPFLNPNYAYGSVYDLTNNQIHLSSNYQICRILVDESGNMGGSSWNLGLNANFCGFNPSGNSGTSPHGVWCPRYPFYYNGEPLVYEALDIEVLVSDVYVPTPIPTGHATQPNNDPNNLINGSNGNPIARPTPPTITSYSPTVWNPPSIDTSTIETLLESIWECLEYGFNYLKDNLSGWFNNLLSNLDSWFGYVVDSIYYACNKIVKSIQDFATDLYNNFVSLFEPIYDFLSSVSSFFSSLVDLGTDQNGIFSLTTFFVNLLVPDTDDLSSTMLQADVFGVLPLGFAIKNFTSTFVYTINNLQVSKIFTIPSFTAFGITFPAYQMDFSWFDNYKVYSDSIISGFLIIGYLHWFFVQGSSMLRGSGVIGHEQSTDASKKVGD